ncbi:MAG: O-antigen ligase family protein [bacterium]
MKLRASAYGPELGPGLMAAGVFVAWAAVEGGFEPTAWYPGGLFLLGLLAVAVFAFHVRGRISPGRGMIAAIALLGAFAVWSFVSITWSDVQGDAWDGANRVLLYLITFALFALLPWRPRSAALVLGGYCVALATLAVITVADLAASSDPTLGFIAGALSDPTGYHNATAALLLAAFFPALVLASRREVAWLARGLLLASAGILFEVALISQSRGSVIAFPLVALVFVALAPGRARLILWSLPVAAAAALAADPLLDVFKALDEGGSIDAAVDDALRAILLSASALFALGAAGALVERRVSLSPSASRAGARAVGAAALVAAAAGVVIAISVIGNPVTWVGDQWNDFKSGQENEFGESRFTSGLGSNRYDFWRVSMDEFADSPITGIGIEQFAVDYLREGRSREESLYPHSVEVRIVSQTGLVGTAFFAGFLIVATLAALRLRQRAGNSLTGAVAIAGLGSFAYWFAHGSGDWFWAFAGLGAPAFAWLALAGSVRPEAGPEHVLDDEQEPEAPASPAAGRWVAIAAGVVLAAAALISFVLPWAAARDVELAAQNWSAGPEVAFERLDRARGLNFLSDRPDVIAGTIALRLGDERRARDSFEAALERNPLAWYPRLELGAIAARKNERGVALAQLRRARELAPRDELVKSVLQRVSSGRTVSLSEIENQLRDRVCALFGRTAETPDCD